MKKQKLSIDHSSNVDSSSSPQNLLSAFQISLTPGSAKFQDLVSRCQTIDKLKTKLCYILLVWEIVKVTKTKMKIILSLVMVEFGMKFLIAVCCAFWWTYYELLFKTYFEWTYEHLRTLDPKWREFHTLIINIYRNVMA